MNWLKRLGSWIFRPFLKKAAEQSIGSTALSQIPSYEDLLKRAQARVMESSAPVKTVRQARSYLKKYKECTYCQGKWWKTHTIRFDKWAAEKTVFTLRTGAALSIVIGACVALGCVLAPTSTFGLLAKLLILILSGGGGLLFGSLEYLDRLKAHKKLQVQYALSLPHLMKSMSISLDEAIRQVFNEESRQDQERLVGGKSELYQRRTMLNELVEAHEADVEYLRLRVAEESGESGYGEVPEYLNDQLRASAQQCEFARREMGKIDKIKNSLIAYLESERDKDTRVLRAARDHVRLQEMQIRGRAILGAIAQAHTAAETVIDDVRTRREAFASAVHALGEKRLIQGLVLDDDLTVYDQALNQLVKLGVRVSPEVDPTP